MNKHIKTIKNGEKEIQIKSTIKSNNQTIKKNTKSIYSVYFVFVTDSLREEVRELLDYLKEDQPDDELSVIILKQEYTPWIQRVFYVLQFL